MLKYLIFFILLSILLIKIIPNEYFGINPLMFLPEIKENKNDTILEDKHIKKMKNILDCYNDNYYECIKKKKIPYIKPIR